MIERTLVLIKPDGVKRALIGECITRFEKRGLKIVAMKMRWIDKDFAMKHYTEDITRRRGEKVRNKLIDFIISGPVVAMVIEGVHAVEAVRKIVGDTEPRSAMPGTIRGDFAHVSYSYADAANKAIENLIHASSSIGEAKQEIALWFSSDEIHTYKTSHETHVL
ncbi:MAG: nucleoside-diphosphate kinase [Candidatus Pacearchaeota archaeon]